MSTITDDAWNAMMSHKSYSPLIPERTSPRRKYRYAADNSAGICITFDAYDLQDALCFARSRLTRYGWNIYLWAVDTWEGRWVLHYNWIGYDWRTRDDLYKYADEWVKG